MADSIIDYDWTWRDFGFGLHLATKTGGAKTVLVSASASGRPRSSLPVRLEVRGADGILRPIKEEDDVARVIARAPEMLRLLEEIVAKDEAAITALNGMGVDVSDGEAFALTKRAKALVQEVRGNG